jgi:Bacitracin resistance protein BacA
MGRESMTDICTRGLDTGFVDLGFVKVAVLGLVQGITELLPISSTAHMRIVPAILGWNDPGSAFSAAMQLAALAAVMSYFWQDVKDLTTNSVQALLRRQFDNPVGSAERLQFAPATFECHRLGLRGNGDSSRDRRTLCSAQAHHWERNPC